MRPALHLLRQGFIAPAALLATTLQLSVLDAIAVMIELGQIEGHR
jgi:hypothetical protein